MSTQGWAIRLERRDAAAAGRLRQTPGVEVCEAAEAVWLRGPQSGEELHWQLAAVAGARRFSVLPDGQLLPSGGRLPQGWLPKGPWVAVSRWMGLEFPPALLAGRGEAAVPLALTRSDRVQEPSLLLTSFKTWAEYAAGAPQVRLDRWRFAVASEGRVAILGQPLPPLPGQRWVVEQGIAVPAGWTWSPAVEAAIVREIFGIGEADVALWKEDNVWERISAEGFVKASRAAVRETSKSLELRTSSP